MLATANILIDLRLSLVSFDAKRAQVLTTLDSNHRTRKLPVFTVDLQGTETLEQALRQHLGVKLSSNLSFIEQISIKQENGRLICDLLGLVRKNSDFRPAACDWWPLFELFPWEDWRKCMPEIVSNILLPQLHLHAKNQGNRLDDIAVLFAEKGYHWVSENIDQRFELLYRAGLLPEALRDQSGASVSVRHHHVAVFGQIMLGEDRRRLGKSLSRLRQLLQVRPIMHYLLSGPFSLGYLQKAVENISGIGLHTQNFRRDVLRLGLVAAQEAISNDGAGRPAKQYNWATSANSRVTSANIPLPRKKCGVQKF